MIQEGSHIKNRENPNHQQPTKSSLSLKPSPLCYRQLSLSTTWEPGIFRGSFLHLEVPCPCAHCILFTTGCAKMNWAAALLPFLPPQSQYFHVPCPGEKECSPGGKILAGSVMGFSYHPVGAPGLHWSGSDTFLFRLWRDGHPVSLGEVLQWASHPAVSSLLFPACCSHMRNFLVTNCRAGTTKHTIFRGMVLAFSQGLHGKDALLRLRNTTASSLKSHYYRETKKQRGQMQSHVPLGKQW